MISTSWKRLFLLALIAVSSLIIEAPARVHSENKSEDTAAVSSAGNTPAVKSSGAAPIADGKELVFGMSSAFSGPVAMLGQQMKDGVEAAFAAANATGGVAGQKLMLIALDDQYDPRKVPANIIKLIKTDRVLGIIGDVGTPTAVTALPIVLENKVLFFAPVTGAPLLRKEPPDRYVINYRASYLQETEAMIDALIDRAGMKPEEIAFFTQRDSYGDAGFSGGLAALRKRSPDIYPVHARYERNTLGVENAIADLLSARVPPKAIIMVGTYAPCAKFIKLARENGIKALFLNVSFVGSNSLLQRLADDGEGVVVTQVVPHYEGSLEIVQDYQKDIARIPGSSGLTGFVSLEGYIAGRILIKALRSIPGGNINRETLVQSFEGLKEFDLGLGTPLELNAGRHQASDMIWPTVIEGGAYRPLHWEELAALRKRMGV